VTHDELLAKIDSLSCCSGAHELSLKAIMELHKPKKFEVNVNQYKMICGVCPEGRFGGEYPCPTIQAIEKELV
jgi:hypothetical protein